VGEVKGLCVRVCVSEKPWGWAWFAWPKSLQLYHPNCTVQKCYVNIKHVKMLMSCVCGRFTHLNC